jgi:hypothetical protein
MVRACPIPRLLAEVRPEADIGAFWLASDLASAAHFNPRQSIRSIHHFIGLLNLSGQNRSGLGGTNVYKNDARAGGGIRSCVEQRGRGFSRQLLRRRWCLSCIDGTRCTWQELFWQRPNFVVVFRLMEWRAPPQRWRHSVSGQPIRRE